jgi:sigma-B regulation protein RsbU (phosphoserine phosphatase)
MKIVIFNDIETSKREIFSLFEENTDDNIVIDFGDNFINPQILYFMLFIQREAVLKKISVIFIVGDEASFKKLLLEKYNKYFSIFNTYKEYENLKRFIKFKVANINNEKFIKELITNILTNERFNVTEYTSREFLDKKRIDEDVVILDYRDEKKNFFEVIKRIKHLDKNIPVILLSNDGDLEQALTTIRLGVNEIVRKPFKREEMSNAVKRVAVESELVKENERLFREIQKREKELTILYNNLEKELNLASEIQKSLMPKNDLYFGDYRIRYIYKPSQNIGGDFCDILEIDENNFAVAFADISGHGIPASLLSTMLKVYILNYGYDIKNTAELTETLNEDVIKVFPKGKFISLFYLMIDFYSNKMKFCKAAQESAFLFRGNTGEIEELSTEGQVLGLFSKIDFPDIVNFEEKTTDFFKGDKLLLYTDGIVEARNSAGEFFGTERIKEILFKNRNSDNILDIILRELYDFTESYKLEDDLTFLLIERD